MEDVYKTNPIIGKKSGLISYKLTMDKPPTVDRFDGDRITLTIDLKTKIRLLSLIQINMNSKAKLIVAIQSDETSKKLEAKLIESKLKMESAEHRNPILIQLSVLYYRLLTSLIDNRLAHHYEELALSSNLYSFALPELEEENLSPIPLDIAKITSKTVMYQLFSLTSWD